MNNFIYEEWERSLQAAIAETLTPFLKCAPVSCDEEDFFPGQRFFTEIYAPVQIVLFMELSLPFKKNLIEAVFGTDWKEVSDVVRDDCFLEILNIINRKNIRNLYGSSNIRFRCSSPRVIYDEYEDDLEVSTLDMYRFDYNLQGDNLALILGMPPGPFLIPPEMCE